MEIEFGWESKGGSNSLSRYTLLQGTVCISVIHRTYYMYIYLSPLNGRSPKGKREESQHNLPHISNGSKFHKLCQKWSCTLQQSAEKSNVFLCSSNDPKFAQIYQQINTWMSTSVTMWKYWPNKNTILGKNTWFDWHNTANGPWTCRFSQKISQYNYV